MKTSIATSPDECVRLALQGLLEAADTANEAACAFSNEVLNHKKNLLSEATIARETATLLLHATQNLARIALASIEPTEVRE